jgi:histidinol-phosphate aminotransferase
MQANEFLRQIHAYAIGKPLSELERESGISDCIQLGRNENPLGPAPSVIEAIKEEAANIGFYPDPDTFLLRCELAKCLELDKYCFTFGHGSSDVMDLVIRTFVSFDKEVIASQYAYSMYKILTQMVGGRFVEAPAKNFGLDLDEILKKITPKTAMICLANPNNPTGTYVETGVLEDFIRKVPKNIIILLDEAYIEYLPMDSQVLSLLWLENYPNIILVRTFSKAYGLAGLRLGYALSSKEIAKILSGVRQAFSVNSLAEKAAIAALHASDHMEQTLAMNRVCRKQLENCFNELGLDFIPSKANFVSVDCKRPAAGIYAQLLQCGIITRHLSPYGLAYHLRVTTGTPEQISRFCHEFSALIKKK